VIDLLLKLVDRLIDLAKRREEVNRAIFVNFIQPAVQTFEIVHTDYIDSLVRYKSRLADQSLAMDLNHPIFGDIELDALKTDHLRTKLRDFRPNESQPKIQRFLTAIDSYLRGVSASAGHADLIKKLAGGDVWSLGPNDMKGLFLGRSRMDLPWDDVLNSDPLRFELRNILIGFDAYKPENDEEEREQLAEAAEQFIRGASYRDSWRREQCLHAISGLMRHFQSLYGGVSSAYSELRSELMTAH
jgi:hypothetical protein